MSEQIKLNPILFLECAVNESRDTFKSSRSSSADAVMVVFLGTSSVRKQIKSA